MSKPEPIPYQKALEVKLPDAWFRTAARFDEANLVSFAGLAPLLALAEQAGLSELISGRVQIDPTATRSRWRRCQRASARSSNAIWTRSCSGTSVVSS